MPYVDEAEDQGGDCDIIGWFGIFVQAVLTIASIVSLVGKCFDKSS